MMCIEKFTILWYTLYVVIYMQNAMEGCYGVQLSKTNRLSP